MSLVATDLLLDPKTIVVRRETRQRQLNVHEFEDLKASIKATGIINPIVCRKIKDQHVLVAGERRLLASIALELETVPVRSYEALTEAEAEVIELEENVKRKDLLWRDHVRSVGRLHALYMKSNKNWLVSQTCQALSIHQTHLHKILRVYDNLDSPRIAHVESIEQAYNTLAKFAERKAESIVTDIIANGAAVFNSFGDLNISTKPQPAADGDFTITSSVKIAEERKADSAVFDMFDSINAKAKAPTSGVETGVMVKYIDAVVKPENPIINADFLLWAKTYDGPKFSLIHCDFPYGNYKGEDSKGSMAGVETENFYDNHESIYWDLLNGLVENLDRLMSYSAHLVFWFNMNFYTETVRRLRGAGLMVHDHPLVWHKTPGGGGGLGVVPGTATTYPRRTYDTALLAVRGNRPLAKPGMNSYAAPTVGNKIHPSQKPEPMLRHFLSMVVDETTNVLDPTCGSGAALRAAEDLGAKSILGIEMDPNYAASANARTLQARVLRQAGMLNREEN
jgi:ParB/RepB/Spo0J family partition protein